MRDERNKGVRGYQATQGVAVLLAAAAAIINAAAIAYDRLDLWYGANLAGAALSLAVLVVVLGELFLAPDRSKTADPQVETIPPQGEIIQTQGETAQSQGETI